MKLKAKLTVGWDAQSSTGLTAKELHEAALEAGNYFEFLSRQLGQKEVGEIYHLDKLFRRSTQGSQPIKQFLGTLISLEVKKSLNCHIDVFAYCFLKQAKNFDLLLPFDKQQNQEFWQKYQQWSEIMLQLEKFERFGQNCPKEIAKQYLALRKVVSRPSVRDEIKTLATLLVSGPSTLKQVSEDLGLSYTLGQRTVSVFENITVVEKREDRIYAIATEALPVVVFCLRETCGLDLLSNLDT